MQTSRVEVKPGKHPEALYFLPQPTAIILKQGLVLSVGALPDALKQDLRWDLLVDLPQRRTFHQDAPIIIAMVFPHGLPVDLYQLFQAGGKHAFSSQNGVPVGVVSRDGVIRYLEVRRSLGQGASGDESRKQVPRAA